MREHEPRMQTIKISDVKNALSNVVHRVYRKETRVLIEKSGIPVAAIVSIEDLQRLAQWEHQRDERFAVIDRMREAFQDVSPEEIAREAERSVAAARQRRRQRTPEAVARSA